MDTFPQSNLCILNELRQTNYRFFFQTYCVISNGEFRPRNSEFKILYRKFRFWQKKKRKTNQEINHFIFANNNKIKTKPNENCDNLLNPIQQKWNNCENEHAKISPRVLNTFFLAFNICAIWINAFGIASDLGFCFIISSIH